MVPDAPVRALRCESGPLKIVAQRGELGAQCAPDRGNTAAPGSWRRRNFGGRASLM
jgi:hypothetical protein